MPYSHHQQDTKKKLVKDMENPKCPGKYYRKLSHPKLSVGEITWLLQNMQVVKTFRPFKQSYVLVHGKCLVCSHINLTSDIPMSIVSHPLNTTRICDSKIEFFFLYWVTISDQTSSKSTTNLIHGSSANLSHNIDVNEMSVIEPFSNSFFVFS